MTVPPPLLVVVAICDDPAQLCAMPTCPLAAGLVVKPHRKMAARGDSWWCVKHWGLLRRLLVRRRYGIHYGQGVPERIAERLSTRITDNAAGHCGAAQ
jgi:hypothetical protein